MRHPQKALPPPPPSSSAAAAASFVELEFEPGFEPKSVFDSEDPRIDSSSFLEPESETSFVEPESVFDSEDPRIDSSSFLEPVPEPGLEPWPVFGIEAPKQVRSVLNGPN